jgi:hypothetical protein
VIGHRLWYQFHSIPFHSITFHNIPIHSIPTQSIPTPIRTCNPLDVPKLAFGPAPLAEAPFDPAVTINNNQLEIARLGHKYPPKMVRRHSCNGNRFATLRLCLGTPPIAFCVIHPIIKITKVAWAYSRHSPIFTRAVLQYMFF